MAGDDQGPKVVTVIWTVAVVPVAFVALRLWTRLRLSHSYGWDDTVIIVANVWLILRLTSCSSRPLQALTGFPGHSHCIRWGHHQSRRLWRRKALLRDH